MRQWKKDEIKRHNEEYEKSNKKDGKEKRSNKKVSRAALKEVLSRLGFSKDGLL